MIKVRMRAVDGCNSVKSYKTLIGAARAVERMLGFLPDEGYSAVSNDGICVVSISGASFADFWQPAPKAEVEYLSGEDACRGYVVKYYGPCEDGVCGNPVREGVFASGDYASSVAAACNAEGTEVYAVVFPLFPFCGPLPAMPSLVDNFDDIPF